MDTERLTTCEREGERGRERDWERGRKRERKSGGVEKGGERMSDTVSIAIPRQKNVRKTETRRHTDTVGITPAEGQTDTVKDQSIRSQCFRRIERFKVVCLAGTQRLRGTAGGSMHRRSDGCSAWRARWRGGCCTGGVRRECVYAWSGWV